MTRPAEIVPFIAQSRSGRRRRRTRAAANNRSEWSPVKRRLIIQLLAFAIIAFVVAWTSWFAALAWPRLPKIAPLAGLFAPAFAAALVGGRAGRRALVLRAARWRFSFRWYGIALLLMPTFYAVALWIDHAVFGFDLSRLWSGSSPIFLAASFAWLLFVTSGEEIGWRGFALPRLLDLGLSPLTSSVVLGLVWGLWHLPFYLAPGQSSIPYPLFLLLATGLSLVYTALFLRTNGSLVPAVLLHATTDFGARLYRIDRFDGRAWLLVDLLVAAAGILLLQRARVAATT